MRHHHARRRDDRGAVVLEFAFVSLILIVLLTGVISFGLILSFKQNLTQAAAEGARAGATALAGEAVDDARETAENAVSNFDQECGVDGLTCTFVEEDCGEAVPDLLDDPLIDNCITVELVYDYDAFPILPEFPILSALYPDTLRSSSTSETNPS